MTRKTKRYISFGSGSIKQEMFKDIGTSNLKPTNGLFGYDYLPKSDSNSPYEEWCEKEGLDRGSLRTGMIFTVKENASIYTINTWADLHKLITKFPIIRTIQGVSGEKVVGIDINYAEVAKKYDGIRFTYNGVANTTLMEEHEIDLQQEKSLRSYVRKYDIDGNIKLDTSNWEIPGIVIFNPDVIESAREFHNPVIHLLDYNEMYDEVLKEIKNGKTQEQIDIELQAYGQDDVTVSEVYDTVVIAEKKEEKHSDLLDRLSGLISLQMSGELNVDKDIDLTVRGIYEISPKSEEFDKFSKYVCTSLRTGILALGYNKKEMEDEVDLISSSFGSFFDE